MGIWFSSEQEKVKTVRKRSGAKLAL